MLKKKLLEPTTSPTRRKSLTQVAEGMLPMEGEIEFFIGIEGIGNLLGITCDELQKIEFRFTQSGQAIFTPRVQDNKVVNSGFIRLFAKTINYPEAIPEYTTESINNMFFDANDNRPIAIPVKMEGQLQMENIQDGDEVLETFQFEGAKASFARRTGLVVAENGPVTNIYLTVRAFINARLTVFHFKPPAIDTNEGRNAVKHQGE